MKNKGNVWDVKVCQKMDILFTTEVPCTILSEKSIVNLARTLVSKYALTDAEIVSQFISKTSKLSSCISEVNRFQSQLDEPLGIWYSVQVADISVDIALKRCVEE